MGDIRKLPVSGQIAAAMVTAEERDRKIAEDHAHRAVVPVKALDRVDTWDVQVFPTPFGPCMAIRGSQMGVPERERGFVRTPVPGGGGTGDA